MVKIIMCKLIFGYYVSVLAIDHEVYVSNRLDGYPYYFLTFLHLRSRIAWS